MVLEAGVMSITIEYAKDLKDKDWFGKQDPYCIIRVGGQTFRTRTAVDGGRNPVWNETFKFNIINENNIDIDIKDSDVGRDDFLGSAVISLARARQFGSDRTNAPVIRKKSRKQKGFVSVAMTWAPSSTLHQPTATRPQYAMAGPHELPAYPVSFFQAPPQQPAPMAPSGGYYYPPGQYFPPAAAPPPAQPYPLQAGCAQYQSAPPAVQGGYPRVSVTPCR